MNKINQQIKNYWGERNLIGLDISEVKEYLNPDLVDLLVHIQVPTNTKAGLKFCSKLLFYNPEQKRYLVLDNTSGYETSICLDTSNNQIILILDYTFPEITFINSNLEKFLLSLIEHEKILNLIIVDEEYVEDKDLLRSKSMELEENLKKIDPKIFDTYHYWPVTIEEMSYGM